MAFCARWLGRGAQVEAVARLAGADTLGTTSFAGLAKAARALGLESRCYRLGLGDLRRVTSRTPAIAHVEGSHFVVAWMDSPDEVTVVQPPAGSRRMSLEAFGRRWNGAVLVVSPPGEQPAWSLVPAPWIAGAAALVASWLLVRSAGASRRPGPAQVQRGGGHNAL